MHCKRDPLSLLRERIDNFAHLSLAPVELLKKQLFTTIRDVTSDHDKVVCCPGMIVMDELKEKVRCRVGKTAGIRNRQAQLAFVTSSIRCY